MKKITVGIDASRNKSGGAVIHIVGILRDLDPSKFGISEIHLWSYEHLLDQISDKNWLIKHKPESLSGNIITQLKWQRYMLPKELKKAGCDVLLSTDAGTVCRFKDNVVMSRDMLSYEEGMIKRYGLFTKRRLRLNLLRYIQNSSLRSARSVIFLTKYAQRVIEASCGGVKSVHVIPHGVSSEFFGIAADKQPFSGKLKLIYVSNAAPYKNQLTVMDAVNNLYLKGYNVSLTLVGGGEARYLKPLRDFSKRASSSDIFKFVGKLKHEDLAEKIKDSDVFIFASSCENMPNTLVEGMSTGLPILCSNKGPMPEILRDGGIYFDPNSTVSIEGAIELIISDKELVNRIKSRSYQLSKEYSWRRCSNELFQLLANVARKNSEL